MLRKLYISNFVIIDRVELQFDSGFSAITGETGAGKSILLDALSLILGKRSDTHVLRDKEKKAIVEGIFHCEHSELVSSWLQAHDIDSSSEIIIRREISHNGKTRAFINDTPVNLQQLKIFSRLLIDIHQQFETQEISSSDFQREVVDAVAGCVKETENYHQQYLQYKNQEDGILKLKADLEDMKSSSSYKQFLLEELNEVKLQTGEDELLEKEWSIMKDAENLNSLFQEGIQLLKEGNPPLLNTLKKLSTKLASFGEHHHQIKEIAERVNAVKIELDDIAGELEKLQDLADFDEAKKEKVLQRLELIYRLQKKHQVNRLEGLLEIQEQLMQYEQLILQKEESLIQLQKNAQAFHRKLEVLAKEIHQRRITEAPVIQEKVNKLLHSIGMPHARTKIEVNSTAHLNPYGADNIQFLFNANVPSGLSEASVKFESLEKVASGGELSRLMLCVQSLVAEKIQLPTLIFDEIDSGISGEAAIQVSRLLTSISANHQIIAITHLPQVAAKAKAHYYVSKKEKNGAIIADITLLNDEERVNVLAAMLGGKGSSDASKKTAKELMG